MYEMFMFEFERNELVEILRSKGIASEQVLNAFNAVERHEFVLPALRHLAYKDSALPIQKNQTISQPYTVAIMTEKLKLRRGDRILEIGTGSGYQAAILYSMGAEVFTIERDEELHKQAMMIHKRLGMKIEARCGDGTVGWQEKAPFQGIIVTAGGPKIPDTLRCQLTVKGRMAIPVGSRTLQSLHIVTRVSDTGYMEEKIPNFQFVPLIGKEGWKSA